MSLNRPYSRADSPLFTEDRLIALERSAQCVRDGELMSTDPKNILALIAEMRNERVPVVGWVWCEAETDGTVTRRGRMCHRWPAEGWEHCAGPHHSLYAHFLAAAALDREGEAWHKQADLNFADVQSFEAEVQRIRTLFGEAERERDMEHRAGRMMAERIAGLLDHVDEQEAEVQRLRAALERIRAWAVDTPYGFVAAAVAAAALDRDQLSPEARRLVEGHPKAYSLSPPDTEEDEDIDAAKERDQCPVCRNRNILAPTPKHIHYDHNNNATVIPGVQ